MVDLKEEMNNNLDEIAEKIKPMLQAYSEYLGDGGSYYSVIVRLELIKMIIDEDIEMFRKSTPVDIPPYLDNFMKQSAKKITNTIERVTIVETCLKED